MRIFLLFLLTVNILHGQRDFSFSDHSAKANIFDDLDFLCLQNGNEGSFADLYEKAENLKSLKKIRTQLYTPDNGILSRLKTDWGEEMGLALQYNEIQYTGTSDNIYYDFFPNRPGTFSDNHCIKTYFGSTENITTRGNIYKIRTYFLYNANKFKDYSVRKGFYDKVLKFQLSSIQANGFKKVSLPKGKEKTYGVEHRGPMWTEVVKFNIIDANIFEKDDITLLLFSGKSEFTLNGKYYNVVFMDLINKNSKKTDPYAKIKSKYMVNGKDIRDVNTKQLKDMISVFIEDCKEHNIQVNTNQQMIATFTPLEGGTIARALSMNNDNKIWIEVDPDNWVNAGRSSRWYTIYHELGHDILNLDHGNGGSMMFNYAPDDYAWSDFLNDKEEMFNAYLKNGKN
jgi:hypothetical protein